MTSTSSTIVIRPLRRVFGGLAAVLFAGCASETFSLDEAPEFLVIHDQTPVYRLGPQQAAPPEERLAKNDRVRLLRREFGYSFALLADGQTGYVANEALTPAPEISTAPRPADDAPKPDLNALPADAPAF